MGLIDNVIKRLGGVTEAAAAKRATEAHAAGYYDGNDDPVSGTTASFNYRRNTSKTLRDFSNVSRGDALNTAWQLWASSPIAKRVSTLKRDYLTGGEVSPVAKDDNLQPIIDVFWQKNKMDRRSDEFALQLFLLGEQCYSVFVRESDGKVRLGYIDPAEIEEVVPHPQNALEMWAVIVGNGDAYADKKVYKIIREDDGIIQDGRVLQPTYPDRLVTAEQSMLDDWETALLSEHKLSEYTGDVFFEKVNSVSNQARGYSDLLQVADWIDQADEVLFALADREQMAGYWSWFIKVIGADPSKLSERRSEVMKSPPSKGSFLFHNDAEEWSMNSPDLRQAPSIETFKALVGQVLGGLGIPSHWYAFGDGTNRATAVAQGDPTHKSLEHDQGIIRDLFTTMLEFVRDQAIIAGAYRPAESDDESVTVRMPQITMKRVTGVSQAMQQTALSLIAATDAGLMTEETAITAWTLLLNEAGLELTPATEIEAIREQMAGQQLSTTQGDNDNLSGMLGGDVGQQVNLTSDESRLLLEVIQLPISSEQKQAFMIAMGVPESLAAILSAASDDIRIDEDEPATEALQRIIENFEAAEKTRRDIDAAWLRREAQSNKALGEEMKIEVNIPPAQVVQIEQHPVTVENIVPVAAAPSVTVENIVPSAPPTPVEVTVPQVAPVPVTVNVPQGPAPNVDVNVEVQPLLPLEETTDIKLTKSRDGNITGTATTRREGGE